MKALVYNSAHDVSIKDAPDPKSKDANGVSVRTTATNIRSFDPHMYEACIDRGSGARAARAA